MKRNHKIIASLIIAAGISGTAFAQGRAGCDGMGPMGTGPMAGQMGRPALMKFDPATRAELHLDMLKGSLKLNKEQEPLWQAYSEKMRAEAGKGRQAFEAQAGDGKLTAPERMAKMQTAMEERLVGMKGVHESFGRLYAALAPKQKATADQHVARMGQGMSQRGGGMGGPGRGMPQKS
jgi:periplasmic protein CpxP/Spy